MNRRAFISALGGAVAWPLAARAQQPAMPVVGVLRSGVRGDFERVRPLFYATLNEAGYFEGRNVRVEHRAADGQYDRLAGLAAELISYPVSVLVAMGDPAALAAKAATTTVPIVFNTGSDPVRLGLVASMSRPSGNLTGVSQMNNALGAKRLQLLRDLVPRAMTIGVLVNPINPNTAESLDDLAAAASALGVQLTPVEARSDGELEAAFAALERGRVQALLMASDPLFLSRRKQIVTLAERHALPTIYTVREYAMAGGLASYAANQTELYRQTAAYVVRILKGTRPSELPVPQPTKFELVINLPTARAIGLEVPPTLLARADEVIE
jgi:putative ABC transport system substrate-binding protein